MTSSWCTWIREKDKHDEEQELKRNTLDIVHQTMWIPGLKPWVVVDNEGNVISFDEGEE